MHSALLCCVMTSSVALAIIEVIATLRGTSGRRDGHAASTIEQSFSPTYVACDRRGINDHLAVGWRDREER